MSGDCCFFQLTLLQTWQLRREGVVVHLAARQQRLITALAIHGPRRRSYVAGLLWPENTEPKALESLRVSVHLVSRQAPGLLAIDGPVVSLSEDVDVDLHHVRARIRQLREVGTDGNVASYLHLLRHADLLPDWYDDWVLYEQSKLHQDRLHAFQTIAKTLMGRCAYEDAVEALEAALELEPLYENAVGMLIQAQMQQGNTAAAFHAFETYRLKLKAEMDLDPSDAVRSLLGSRADNQQDSSNVRT